MTTAIGHNPRDITAGDPASAMRVPGPRQAGMIDQAARAHHQASLSALDLAHPRPRPTQPLNPGRVAPVDASPKAPPAVTADPTPVDHTASIDLAGEGAAPFDPAAPLDSPENPVGGSPAAPVDPKAKEAADKKKAEDARESKRNLFRKISMFVAPILLLVGITALCFVAATAITGFSWVAFSIALIVGIGCFAGCGLTTYFGLIRIKKVEPPKIPPPKPAP